MTIVMTDDTLLTFTLGYMSFLKLMSLSILCTWCINWKHSGET